MAKGAALREWRVRHGLKPEQVAVAAKVSRQTVENWENGKGEPGASQVVAMAALAPGLPTALGLIGGAA
jgi:transcriptional regulator with XRE-family HTH domain